VEVLFSLFWPKQYTATASVVVDAKPDPVNRHQRHDRGALDAYVTTQADVISSIRVAQRVVRALKLDQVPISRAWRKKTDGVGDITVWLATIWSTINWLQAGA